MSARLFGDSLANYSARDLVTALHWTSKQNLIDALGTENVELWDKLIGADRNLQEFYSDQLAQLIQFNKKSMSK